MGCAYARYDRGFDTGAQWPPGQIVLCGPEQRRDACRPPPLIPLYVYTNIDADKHDLLVTLPNVNIMNSSRIPMLSHL